MPTGMCERLTELNMFREKFKDSSTQQTWTWNLQKYENSASLLSAPEPDVTLETSKPNQSAAPIWFNLYHKMTDFNSQRGL